jgi:hypothetical protein
MKLPFFIRQLLWQRCYRQQLNNLKATSAQANAPWLILFDGSEPGQTELAGIIRDKQPQRRCVCVSYQPLHAEPHVIPVWEKDIDNQLQLRGELAYKILKPAYALVLMLSPDPSPTLRSLSALAQTERRVAINPAKNDDLYPLVFTWPACDAETAAQRLFGQLKTFVSHAI